MFVTGVQTCALPIYASIVELIGFGKARLPQRDQNPPLAFLPAHR
jgi:hypothetical protein